MKEIRVLLIGVGGYGMGYAREMLEHGAEKRASIAGVVDPYAASSPVYQALKDAIEMLQTWLQTNWDEALWGDVSKMPSVNGEYVDWKTMNVIYSENPPVKPDDYVPMS